jgi:ribosomal protein S18 acetylase RimI-like enzyme
MTENAAPSLIRRARPDDAEAVAAVATAAFSPYVGRLGDIEPWPMHVDYAEKIGQGHTWVAENDGAVVGLLVLEPQDDHLLLDIVGIAPGHQGTGLGNRLLGVADQQARALGLPEVRLYTNVVMTENLAYYPRQGYVETHREQVGPYHRVFFTKVLAPTI